LRFFKHISILADWMDL